MSSKASQVVLVQHGDGFLNGLVPDFARMLDDQLSSSSALGSILSERSYRGDVLRFNQWRGDRPIDKALIEKYLKYLSRQEYSPSYITRILASIRWYVNRIHDLLLDDATLRSLLPPEERKAIIETAERCLVAKAPRGSRAVGIEAGRYIPVPEFHKLMEECLQDDSKAGARDRAMIALAWQLGPRVHEIAGLTMKDITLAEGTAPGYFVRIIGKGNKQRPVTPKLVGNAARYLKDWLAVRGETPGALFCFISYLGNLRRLDQNLTPKTLHSILKDRVAQAGLPPTTWHDFRRTILSDVIARSGLTTAQHLAGHSSSATTARYDRLWRENVQEAINYRPDAPSPTGANPLKSHHK
jgi:site-specific recombinase XerD